MCSSLCDRTTALISRWDEQSISLLLLLQAISAEIPGSVCVDRGGGEDILIPPNTIHSHFQYHFGMKVGSDESH